VKPRPFFATKLTLVKIDLASYLLTQPPQF
jgi:hypothetical protein